DSLSLFSFVMLLQPPTSTLFPYTTLFRSPPVAADDLSTRLLAEPRRLWIVAGRTALCGDRKRPPLEQGWLMPPRSGGARSPGARSEEHTSELQSHLNLVCRLLLEKKKKNN